jgi:hypothetical protein
MSLRLAAVDVPLFLEGLPDDKARKAAAAVLCAVGLLPLPRRTVRTLPVGKPVSGLPDVSASCPLLWRDPAVPACVPFADVELEGDGAWAVLRASSAYGEASCRLGADVGNLGSATVRGSGVSP